MHHTEYKSNRFYYVFVGTICQRASSLRFVSHYTLNYKSFSVSRWFLMISGWQAIENFCDSNFCWQQVFNIIKFTITMTSEWARWRLKSPASPLFTKHFIQAPIKENIKAPRHWPLCGEFTGDQWIPRSIGQWRGKCFHLMTSSWMHPKTVAYGLCFVGSCCILKPVRLCTYICRRHDIEMFSASLALCEESHQSPMDSPHKGRVMQSFHVSMYARKTVE